MSRSEKITLQGGPGDGEVLDLGGKGDQLVWKPICERDLIAIRMNGRVPSEHDPIKYRRSVRSRHIFIYQP